MKKRFAIAALVLGAAVFTPAHATTVILSTTLPAVGTVLGTSTVLQLSATGYPSGSNGSITAYGWDTAISGSNINSPTITLNKATALDVATDGAGKPGLGLKNTGDPYIGPSDVVVLDFSAVKTSESGTPEASVTFNLYKDITGPSQYVLYGMTGAQGSGTATLLASGSMGTTGQVAPITTAVYASYIVGVTTDCSIDLQGVSVNYTQTPEPGTFVMAGIALIGLSITLKKRRQKV